MRVISLVEGAGRRWKKRPEGGSGRVPSGMGSSQKAVCLQVPAHVLYESMGQLVPLASCLRRALTSTSASLSSLEPQHFLM